MSPLERRYRRLLLAYPLAYRRSYGQEMLSVLLDSAGPEQRYPSRRDTLLLLGHALQERLHATGRAVSGEYWPRAAAIVGVMGALFLSARHLLTAVRWVHLPDEPVSYLVVVWVLAAGWFAAALAVLLRQRIAGVVLAVLVGAAEVTSLTWWPPVPWYSLASRTATQVAVALTASVALAVGAAARSRGMHPGWAAAVGAAAVLLVALPSNTNTTLLISGYPFHPFFSVSVLSLVGAAVSGSVLLMLLIRLPGPVRRRVVAVGAPVVVQAVYFSASTAEYYYISGVGPWWTHASPYPVSFSAALPVLVFLAGLVWVARRDRVTELIARGRAAEERLPG